MPEASSPVSRRSALAVSAGVAVAGVLLAGCGKEKEGAEVSPTEDLMREHGVLRRVLIAYRETAHALRATPASVDVAALGLAAELFRSFGEAYHEKMEEQYVFPAVQRLGGQGGAMIATLLGQHARGREITAFVRAKCAAGRVGTADAEPLARALESFARMYEAHTAFEDTVVFQAWRDSLSEGRRREMGERFEQIEHDTFKTDGFEAAVRQVTDIEHRLGLGGPGRYTAPAP